MRIPFAATLVCILLAGTVWLSESTTFAQGFDVPAGPRSSLRGRIYIRNGLLWDVYRERWGNGLTPYGAAVLSNLVYTAGYVGAGYLGVDPSGLRGGGASANGADGDFQTETTEEAAAAAEDAHNERMARIEAAAKDAADSCTRLGLPEKEKPDTLPPPAADDAAAPALGKSKFSKPKS